MTGPRAAALALIALGLLAVGAGCSGGLTATRTVYGPAATVTAHPPHASCAWYSVGRAPSAIVTVTLTGATAAECSRTGEDLAVDTGSEWASTAIVGGELVMTATRGGATLRMYQAGPGGHGFTVFAGYLADDLAANGWMPS